MLVGQAWGAQNVEKVRCIVGSTLFMTLIGGSFIACLGVIFAEQILILLAQTLKMHLSLPYVQMDVGRQPTAVCLYYLYLYFTWSGR